MKIVFWSNVHGQSKQTGNMIASVMMTVQRQRYNCLITQTHYVQNDLEDAVIGRTRNTEEKALFYQDSGIDVLIRSFKQGELTEKIVEECCIKVTDDNQLTLLPGSQSANRCAFEDTMDKMLSAVLARVERFYDVLFVDANPGRNSLSMELLADSDLIVVNLSQNKGTIDAFMRDYPEVTADERTFYLIGGHIAESRYCITNIIRRYSAINLKNSAVIPFSLDYMDALSSGETLDFFERNRKVEHGDLNYDFMVGVAEAVTKMFNKVKKERRLKG